MGDVTYELYKVAGDDEVLYAEGFATVDSAVQRAEVDALEFFLVFRKGGSSYVYCSW